MNNGDRLFYIGMIILFTIAGFLCGVLHEGENTISKDKEIDQLKIHLSAKAESQNYWRERFRAQDKILQRISNHKECTFGVRSIIGDLE